MKVVFLDIDGVLNSGDCMRAYHTLSVKHKVGDTSDRYGHFFDERCVMWLDHIIRSSGAKIVVSSTWRCKGLKFIQDLWNDRGLPGEVIDITDTVVDPKLFDLFPGNGTADRGYEIQQWIEEWSPLQYVILDDDSDMLPHQNFVKCDNKIGITYEVAKSAIAHLNGSHLNH